MINHDSYLRTRDAFFYEGARVPELIIIKKNNILFIFFFFFLYSVQHYDDKMNIVQKLGPFQ